jgi:PAS domain S-box-containing protein
MLDLWMMVVLCAWLFDIGLSAVLNAGRFDLGFYAGRMYGVLASTFVLLVLLREGAALYGRLARALESEQNERHHAEAKTRQLNEPTHSLEAEVLERTADLEVKNEELRTEIAERQHAESDVDEARQRLAGIIESAMDAIITIDEEQKIVLFNATAELIFGCSRNEAIGSSLSRFIPGRFRARHIEHVRLFGETGITSRRMTSPGALMGLRRSGEEFPIDASISHVMVHGRKYYTVIVRDVTERTRAEEALRQSREELREMASVSAAAREQEKSRIARELHDELAQSLSAMRMDVAWLKRRGNDAHEAARDGKLAAMEALLGRTLAATRRIAADLRPLMLDDLGLVPAAQWLVENFRDRYAVDCHLTVAPPHLEIADPQATAVFRIMQEALENVGRHARATRVAVSLEANDGCILLQVSDDGCGFELTNPRKANSFGLVGLRERAHLVDGQLTIESEPGLGTIIEVRIPLPSDAADAAVA